MVSACNGVTILAIILAEYHSLLLRITQVYSMHLEDYDCVCVCVCMCVSE